MWSVVQGRWIDGETAIELKTDLPHPAGMTAGAKQITKAALALSEKDRLQVAAAILKSVACTEVHLADLAALARAQEFDSGKVTSKTQTEVFQKARAAALG